MGKLLVFSGTDGAGKSTQIELLDAYLRATGHNTCRYWARGGYTPLFTILKKTIRYLYPKSLPPPGPSKERTKRLASNSLRKAWLLIAIIDLTLLYAFWMRTKKLLGYTILCDRYIEDTLLDFTYNFPQEEVCKWASWRLLTALCPKPDVGFLLIIPPQESTRRSRLKNEPFPDTPEALNWRYERYKDFATLNRWKIIDCQKSIDSVQLKIRGALRECG